MSGPGPTDDAAPPVEDTAPDVDLEAMEVAVTHRFAAPPAQVWSLLVDVERMAGLGPEHVEARWETAGDIGVGSRFVGRNRLGEREWEVPAEVVACDPPSHVAWCVLAGDEVSSTWTYDLVPDGDGTLVTQRFRHGPGFSFLRHYAQRSPEQAPALIEGRAEMLRTNMADTLAAAERLLLGG